MFDFYGARAKARAFLMRMRCRQWGGFLPDRNGKCFHSGGSRNSTATRLLPFVGPLIFAAKSGRLDVCSQTKRRLCRSKWKAGAMTERFTRWSHVRSEKASGFWRLTYASNRQIFGDQFSFALCSCRGAMMRGAEDLEYKAADEIHQYQSSVARWKGKDTTRDINVA